MDSKAGDKNRKMPGFSLIEVLVYVAVFTIVVGGLAAISIALYRNKTIIEDRINLNEDFRLLNKLIRDDTYTGSDLVVNGTSSFSITHTASNTITYSLNNGKIYRQDGANAPVIVTAATTEVLTFSVQDLSTPAAAETIRIQMVLSNLDVGTLRPEILQEVTTTYSIKFLE